MTLRRLTAHGHTHKDMAPVLRHYGAENVPATGGWRKMCCPFHEDSTASAQADGVGFRCFTCDLFYPAPLTLLQDQEGGGWDDAHALYHRLAGEGDGEVRGVAGQGSLLPEDTRVHARSRSRSSTRRRGGP